MLGLFHRKNVFDPSRIVDEIESSVYVFLKSHGFRRFGRTIHRFVSGDISQIIHFQCGTGGLHGYFCVNLGIRIPECMEHDFHPVAAPKNYYHEYECTIRSRLGTVRGRKETWFNLRKPAKRISDMIIEELQRFVLPVFNVLSSRESILSHRGSFPHFHTHGSALLDECMIYGHLGDLEKAREIFEQYYQAATEEYNERLRRGQKYYLKKGQRIVCMGQDITAEKNGFVTVYAASRGHLDYLDELAEKLGFSHRN